MIIYLEDKPDWNPYQCVICLKSIMEQFPQCTKLQQWLDIPTYDYCSYSCSGKVGEIPSYTNYVNLSEKFKAIITLIQRNTGAKLK